MRTLFALTLAILAATPPQTQLPFGESIEVSIVNVAVFVTDKDGRRVPGLTKDDFEIYEDGKLRPITNFAEYRALISNGHVSVTDGAAPALPPTAAEAPRVEETPTRQQRTIAVFVDRLAMRPNKKKEVLDQLQATLHTLVQPGDSVSIITWENTGIRVRQPYTDDLQKIDAAMASLVKTSSLESNSDLEEIRRADEAEQQRLAMLKAAGVSPGGGGGGPSMEALLLSDRALSQMKAKTAALKALTASMAGADGQKVLVFLSHRFSLNVSKEYLTPKRTLGGPPDKYEVLYDTHLLVDALARTANANGVRIYAIYPAELPGQGVQSPEDNSMPSGAEAGTGGYEYQILGNELGALQVIAERTGGAMTWHPKEAMKLLDRLPDDFSSYYSLAYSAKTSGADKAHSIKVKVKRAGLTVRSRSEFVEKSSDTKMGERVIAELFGIPTAAPTVGVTVSTGPSRNDSKKRFTIPISIKVPIGSLTTLPEGTANRGAFSVYVAWSSGLGQVSDVTHQTQQFTIPASDLQRAKSAHFTYDMNVVADKNTNTIAVGVLDEVSKEFGLATIDLRHPTMTQ